LAKGNNYGWDIVNTVKKLSGGNTHWNNASIYPVLKKMEEQGLIKSYWRIEEEQHPRKYYNLTETGIAEIQNKKAEWVMVNDMLTKLWEQ